MKNLKKITLFITFLLFMFNGVAQTKAPAKKKSPPKEINVYICTNPKDKVFHKRIGCHDLSKCGSGGDIKQIKSAAELKKWKRKCCKRCASM